MNQPKVQISQEELEEKLSNVLLRQTDLSKEDATKLLRDNNYNMQKIIQDYFQLSQKKEKKEERKGKYDLIREFYDT